MPILQEPWEFAKLLDIYKAHAPRKVLEIGSFYGGTIWFWLEYQAATTVDGRNFYELPTVHGSLRCLTSIDYPIGPSDGRYEEMIRCRALWAEWTKDIEFHDIQGDSHNPVTIQRARSVYPHNDVDFLFIDGDHSYAGVKADYENYTPLVRTGGLIVLHDVYGLPEVKQFWKELKKTERTQTIIGQPGGWGIGIVYKQ
ncbi:methyltransferase family protein [Chitinophaga japonensis]|uniref:Methyltransferase family protein n=1 Tax=Chitinophaga japonensis TaxID=104662 RepID=A0A562SZX6_CHIJA|nr:methyltransferase family protein [Chitinophaga japonensis]